MAARSSSSTRYTTMRSALAEIQNDLSAVFALLTSQADQGAWWIETAYRELRQAFVDGRLDDGTRIGGLIGTVIRAQEMAGAAEGQEGEAHQLALRTVVDGIGSILDRDYLPGIETLSKVAGLPLQSRSCKWIAQFWIARAAADAGDLTRAVQAAEEAFALAESLDPETRGSSLGRLGELEYLAGRHERALEHLSAAAKIFEDLGDQQGTAAVWLARAQMLAATGQNTAAVEAATLARQANPEWEQPVLFLARQAFVTGDYDQAEWVLKLFYQVEPRPPEVTREMRLVEIARTGRLPKEVISEYSRLRALPPVDETVDQLERLTSQYPDFHEVREVLAWMLFKRGHDDRAAEQFETLVVQRLDPELHASVLLGLGCLANRRHRHRKRGARLHAAATAGRPAEGAATPPPLPGGLQVVQTADRLDAPADRAAAGALKRISTPGLGIGHGGLRGLDTEDAQEEMARDDEFDLGRELREEDPSLRPSSINPLVRSKQVPSAKVAFSGDLQALSVPELLEFLKSSRRTGTLVLTSGEGIAAIHMRRGMITGCAAPGGPGLGDLLRQSGALSEEQLEDAFRRQGAEDRNELLGTILLRHQIIDEVQLKRALSEQVRGALLEIVEWSSGRFAFEPDDRGQLDSDTDVEIELDTQGVLLDVMRMLDERNREAEQQPGE